jgi:general secretion pathway protein K
MRARSLHHRPRRRERGAALLTAMIIVTLIVTLAASMVWQQWRAVQVEIAERARVQSAWILNGALDWARLILREDARSGRPTALTEPWATPLAEARLSTFLAVDAANAEDAPDAFLSGVITDAQARFNLTNLVVQGKIVQAELDVLDRLCQSVGVSSDIAVRIARGLSDADATSATAGSTSPPLRPRNVAQLAWFGIDAESLELLSPYVVLLPVRTPVNLNTAPREVLAAVVKGLDLATAERIVQTRQRSPYKTVAAVEAQLPAALTPLNPAGGQPIVSVFSSFFEVRGRLRLEDRALEQRSLVERRGLDMIVLRREQVSQRDGAGT